MAPVAKSRLLNHRTEFKPTLTSAGNPKSPTCKEEPQAFITLSEKSRQKLSAESCISRPLFPERANEAVQ